MKRNWVVSFEEGENWSVSFEEGEALQSCLEDKYIKQRHITSLYLL